MEKNPPDIPDIQSLLEKMKRPETEPAAEDKESKSRKPSFESLVSAFTSPENRTRFQALAGKAKEFTGKLYEKSGASSLMERARINSVDRLGVMYNNALYDWHDKKSAGWSSKLSVCDGKIESLKDRVNEHQEALESMQAQFGEISPSVAAEAQRERQRLELRLEKLNNKKDRLQSKLEFRNNKKAIYEGKRKEIVRGVSERIQERLEPYERRIEKLQEQKGQLDTEIENFAEKRLQLAERLKELEDKKEHATFRFESDQLRLVIKEVKKEQKIAAGRIELRIKERLAIEAKLARNCRKADSWYDKQNKFHRISQRGTVYEESGERVAVPINLERQGVTASERRPEEEPGETEHREELARKTEARQPDRETVSYSYYENREKIEDKKLLPRAYIEQWNKYFGSEFLINPVEFEEGLKTALKTRRLEKMTVADLEKALRAYYAGLSAEGALTLRNFPERKLASCLKTHRFYLRFLE